MSKSLKKLSSKTWFSTYGIAISAISFGFIGIADLAIAQNSLAKASVRTEDCEILIVGGGVAGTATAYEGLLAGRTVCMTEITDWVGGQITSQGTSALDEAKKQRNLWLFPKGYT
ncbi:MAG: FAD-dependent oxidoreductase, partial [Chitinophagaceae bacterium]|nr:FAD-dependent oxidoreductase [Chitinophagaceae bacterium]